MHYFTFEIGDEKVGYFEYEQRAGMLYQNARFSMQGELMENPFRVQHEDGEIFAYRFGEEEYSEVSSEERVVPSSALLMLAEHATEEESAEFQLLREDSGEIVGVATLRRNGDRVQTYLDGEPHQYFDFDGEMIVEIGWGGEARSRRVGSLAEAVAGTDWEGEVERGEL